MSDALSDYITAREAADLLGVSDNHVRLLLGNERLKGVKLGHEWLVYRPSLDEYFRTKAPSGKPSSKTPKLELAEK